MRVALVMGGIPGLGHSGSTIASWTIIQELLAAGHDVTAVLLPAGELLDETAAARFEALERLGARVRVIEVPPAVVRGGRFRRRVDFARSLLRPRDDELFPAVRAREPVLAALRNDRVEAGIAFGFEAAASMPASPRLVAVLSHPPGVARRVRLRYQPPRSAVGRASERSFLAYADRRAAAVLRRFQSVGVFSLRHAEWARRRGVNAWYAHYPMPDLAGPDWRAQRAAVQRGRRPRLLMIGHLQGIGTIAGLHLFVPSILPRLTDALGAEGFEVHVVGPHEPPPELAEALRRHPAVRLRGAVAEPEEEFMAADVLLAPNPTTTGASARILSGLTFGNCIVAHTDSLVGIPELEHGANCLLAADGPSLAEETLRALADRAERDRLGEAARALYERAFRPEVAARRLVREVERLAGR